MLAKQFRIKAPDFFRTKTRYQSSRSIHLLVMGRINQKPSSRFVFVVPKSVDKRSTVRHTLRRFLEEEIRQKYMQTSPSHDFYIKIQKLFSSSDFTTVKEELGIAIKKISLGVKSK